MADWGKSNGPGYSKSTIGQGTGFDTSGYGKSGGGTYGFEISLWLTFYNEITKLSNSINPPTFDGGKVTEQLGGGKYKVKLQGLGSVVTAEYSAEPFAASYFKRKPTILKGAYVLIMIQSKNNVGGTEMLYTIQGIRQTGAFAPDPEEVEV